MAYGLRMARQPSQVGDIRVSPRSEEKAAFVKAAAGARQSLNQWMIQAAVERAEREGVRIKRPVSR
jgi:uncharacterized protein (DUF1778 family)